MLSVVSVRYVVLEIQVRMAVCFLPPLNGCAGWHDEYTLHQVTLYVLHGYHYQYQYH